MIVRGTALVVDGQTTFSSNVAALAAEIIRDYEGMMQEIDAQVDLRVPPPQNASVDEMMEHLGTDVLHEVRNELREAAKHQGYTGQIGTASWYVTTPRGSLILISADMPRLQSTVDHDRVALATHEVIILISPDWDEELTFAG
jgi:hypothetical protein